MNLKIKSDHDITKDAAFMEYLSTLYGEKGARQLMKGFSKFNLDDKPSNVVSLDSKRDKVGA